MKRHFITVMLFVGIVFVMVTAFQARSDDQSDAQSKSGEKTGHKVKLELINCSDQQLREELNTGRIDLAFLLTDSVHFKAVNVVQLRTEKLVLVCGQSHPLSQLPQILPLTEDILGEEFI